MYFIASYKSRSVSMSVGIILTSRWRVAKFFGMWSGESMDGRELFREDEVNIGDTFILACMSFPCTAAMHFADIRFTRHYVLAITVPLVYATFSVGDGMSQERALLHASLNFPFMFSKHFGNTEAQ